MQRGYVGDERVEFGLDAPGAVGDGFAFLGEPAGAAVHEHGSELAFESGDVGRHVRLHGVQRRRGRRETAFVGDRHQGRKLPQIHRQKR